MRSTSYVREVEAPSVVVAQPQRPRTQRAEPIPLMPILRRSDKWAITLMALGVSVFSAAMIRFVVFPAMQTLTGSPAEPWSAGF